MQLHSVPQPEPYTGQGSVSTLYLSITSQQALHSPTSRSGLRACRHLSRLITIMAYPEPSENPEASLAEHSSLAAKQVPWNLSGMVCTVRKSQGVRERRGQAKTQSGKYGLKEAATLGISGDVGWDSWERPHCS